jgi:diadenosine tetraphosphate (Ap4A) HIT family hydrolase
MTSAFSLDDRLANDSIFIFDGELSQFRLMNEARFPWLVLVPRLENTFELVDLGHEQQLQLLREVNLAANVLRQRFNCDKINIGALGNIVRQLHVHIVVRTNQDAAWPNPVWGFGIRQAYAEPELARLCEELSTLLIAGA